MDIIQQIKRTAATEAKANPKIANDIWESARMSLGESADGESPAHELELFLGHLEKRVSPHIASFSFYSFQQRSLANGRNAAKFLKNLSCFPFSSSQILVSFIYWMAAIASAHHKATGSPRIQFSIV